MSTIRAFRLSSRRIVSFLSTSSFPTTKGVPKLHYAVRYQSTTTTPTATSTTTLPPLKIMFGSQTGTAQGFAMQLQNHLSDNNIDVNLEDLYDYYTIEQQKVFTENSIHTSTTGQDIIFIVSCFGRGEPTDSAKKFFTYIMSNERDKEPKLTKLRYTIFGLGSSRTHREYYNVVSKALEKRLNELGATCIYPRGEGDSSGESIDADFESWENNLLTLLTKSRNTPTTMTSTTNDTSMNTNNATSSVSTNFTEGRLNTSNTINNTIPVFSSSKSNNPYHSDTEQILKIIPEDLLCEIKPSLSTSNNTESLINIFPASIPYTPTMVAGLSNLTPHEFRPIYEIRLTSNSNNTKLPTFTTGDHVAVYPKNSHDMVLRICKRLRWDPSFRFQITNSNPTVSNMKLPFIGYATIYEVLLNHIAIGGTITPFFLKQIASCATNTNEKEQLLALADRSNYISKIRDNFIQLIDLLILFPSLSIPLDRYLSYASPLLPRLYSISNPGINNDNLPNHELHITFRHLRMPRSFDSLTNTSSIPNNKNNNIFQGVCTSYLSTRSIGDSVNIAIRPSSFRLPRNPETPIVMIAGGIGITPFRAFILDRLIQSQHSTSPIHYGNSLLLYGCRSPTDVIYKSIWDINTNILSKCEYGYTIPPSNSLIKPMLANDLMMQHKDTIWNCLENQGIIYVCGGANGFGTAVSDTIKMIINEKLRNQNRTGSITSDQYMSQLLAENRYLEDLAD